MPAPTIKEIWKEAWNSSVKRHRLIAIMVLIPAFTISLPFFFSYIEKRKGTVIHDWVLAQIPPHNVSVLIFAIIWGMIFLILYRSLYSPSIFITYCFTLAVVTIARVTCITLVPLEPPAGLIRLTDPLTGIFYGNTQIVKDLFFSGHIATLSIIFFSLEKRTDKWICAIGTFILAILLLIQHIHYTIDVLASPLITYMGYLTVKGFLARKSKKVNKESKPVGVLD